MPEYASIGDDYNPFVLSAMFRALHRHRFKHRHDPASSTVDLSKIPAVQNMDRLEFDETFIRLVRCVRSHRYWSSSGTHKVRYYPLLDHNRFGLGEQHGVSNL